MKQMNPKVIEDLEARLAPAGIVTVTTNAAGLLTITGDGGNNTFNLTEAAPNSGLWSISDTTAATGTTFILNGAPAAGTINFSAQQSLKITMNGGDDQVRVNGIQVNGKVDVFGNDGLDLVDFFGCVVNGATTVDSGIGADQLTMMGTYNGMVLKSGAGNDTVNIMGGIQKGVTVDLGADSNVFTMDGPSVSIFGNLIVGAVGAVGMNQTFNLFTDSIYLAGSASFKTAAGNTSFNIGDEALDASRITGNLTVTTGAGNDFFSFTRDIGVGGALTIAAGAGNNEVFSNNLDSLVVGALTYTGGSGLDDVNLSSGGTVIIGGNTVLNLGDGSNGAAFGGTGAAILGGALTFTGGAGNDDLFLNGSFVNVHGALNFKGGNGINSASFSANFGNLSSVNFTGGSGEDCLYLGDSGITGVTVLGNVATNMGAGTSILQTEKALIYGNLVHTNAAMLGSSDLTDIKSCNILGHVSIKSAGTANSTLNFDDSRVGSSFTLDCGAGNDVVLLDTQFGTTSGSFFGGPVNIKLGAGGDTLIAGTNPLSLNSGNTFNGKLNIDGGTGTDLASLVSGFGNTFNALPNIFTGLETVN